MTNFVSALPSHSHSVIGSTGPTGINGADAPFGHNIVRGPFDIKWSDEISVKSQTTFIGIDTAKMPDKSHIQLWSGGRAHGKSAWAQGYYEAHVNKPITITLKADIDKVKSILPQYYKETLEMSADKDILRDYVVSQKSDDEKVLLENKVVNFDGTLTNRGQEFLLQVLFDKFKDDVVSAVKTSANKEAVKPETE